MPVKRRVPQANPGTPGRTRPVHPALAPARRALLCGLLAAAPLGVLTGPEACAQDAAAAVDPEAERLWNDFSHYVLIARPGLAATAADALLKLDDAAVLAAVEADDRSSRRVFERAAGMGDTAPVAARLEEKIASAARAQARDPERIRAEVDGLGNSQRAFATGVDRLTAAGAYAAPELLSRLRDPQASDLHPYILEAMQAIGQPLVAPLSVALPELPPVPQGQVARVLAEIGYPEALPALQATALAPDGDGDARRRAARAFASIAASAGVSTSTLPAPLYTGLGNAAYALGARGEMPPGFDPVSGTGAVWVWSDPVGLVPIEVPGPLYADALARAAATLALGIDATHTPALTLFLSADLRSGITARQQLGGAADPSRDDDLKPADYYLSLAGPERARDVLRRALQDGDAGLALAAIDGFAGTSDAGSLAPLADALDAPDRRVRFAAASALAAARPTEGFSGDRAVVPTLAAAVRRDGQRYAVVIASDEGVRSTLADAASSAGYEPLLGGSLAEVQPQVEQVPGVDLILARGSADDISGLASATRGLPVLGGAPIVAYASAADQVALEGRFGPSSRVTSVVGDIDSDSMQAAGRAAIERSGGEPVAGPEAEAQALEALRLIRELALDGSTVLDADAALPAVTAALEDGREAVATAAGEAAATLDDRSAQSALADAALRASGAVQVAHLHALAASAVRHGNLLSADFGDRLLDLVKNSDGDTALAASRAHGALTLPTEHAVELILAASR